jgi:hypothetical protein
MHDIVLVRFDGTITVCFEGISTEEVQSLLERWNSREEEAAILVWPSGVPLPVSNLVFA